jgi:hypothetical protein
VKIKYAGKNLTRKQRKVTSGGYERSPQGLPQASDLFKRENTEEREMRKVYNFSQII